MIKPSTTPLAQTTKSPDAYRKPESVEPIAPPTKNIATKIVLIRPYADEWSWVACSGRWCGCVLDPLTGMGRAADLGHTEFGAVIVTTKIIADQLTPPALQEVASILTGAVC